MLEEKRCGFFDKKRSGRLRFLWQPDYMSSAVGWNLHGDVSLLRFGSGQIYFHLRHKRHLYLHLVRADEVSRLNLRNASGLEHFNGRMRSAKNPNRRRKGILPGPTW
jgi:hypothetical protein